jgi:UDP-2-acetamido-3-amino-2,3-dideoxy-glucuronate N-acetyltransferase
LSAGWGWTVALISEALDSAFLLPFSWPRSSPKGLIFGLVRIAMAVSDSVVLGAGVHVPKPELVNLYGCTIGDETRVGPFVEIQAGATVGARCKIQSHSFICEGVSIGDEVFVGHGVMFTNDLWPRATDDNGDLLGPEGWSLQATIIGNKASIGSGAVLLPVRVGEGALVAAGAVVTKDVPDFAIVAGNPARVVGDVRTRTPNAGARA